MELFIDSGYLIILNRVDEDKNIQFFSEIFCVDGRTVDPRMLTKKEGRSSREVSIECPTPSDIALWCTALKDFTSDTYTLQLLAGPFLQIPCTATGWLISADKTRLYHQLSVDSLNVYIKHGRTMRQQKFTKKGNAPTLPSC